MTRDSADSRLITAELVILNNLHKLVPGAGVDLRIRCEIQDGERHETRWAGFLQAVATSSGVILNEQISIVLGAGDLNLDSRLDGDVPVTRAGDTVEVWNGDAETSELILVGTLEQRYLTPYRVSHLRGNIIGGRFTGISQSRTIA